MKKVLMVCFMLVIAFVMVGCNKKSEKKEFNETMTISTIKTNNDVDEGNYVIPQLTKDQQELGDETEIKLEEVNATLKKDDKKEVDESNYVIPPLTEELQELIDDINKKLEEVNATLKKDDD